MSYNTRIKLKSDTESNWLSQDPVLLDGEVAIVKCDGGTTRKKIGDGSKKFSELEYDESKSLGLASAAVGQIPKVKAVDSNGVPTEWESVAMPSGGSSDMFYVLDMVDGEGDTYTINNDFDEAVSAIDQGKVFVYEGACLLASYSPSSNGTANQITFDLDTLAGYIGTFTWNRGSSSVTVKTYLSPVIDPGTITTTGVVYYDSGFKIKSEAGLGVIYVIEFSDGVLVNDYTELENAIKNHKIIVDGSNSDMYLVSIYTSYDASSITLCSQYANLLFMTRIAKETKKATTESCVIPSVEEELFVQSESGYVYWDKIAKSYSIKDTTPPIASTSTVGTIKVGNGLSITNDGILSVTTATYYTGASDPVDTLGADGDLYLKTEG